MRNIQQYFRLRQNLILKGSTDERELILDLCERLDSVLSRMNRYNNMPWWKRLFAEI